ncbi:hypothetical protein DWB67_01000 [Paracoccus sp. JM45]|nr:hypothetical protein DWB67_01000 [Paracoccus sp. JM45]
MGGLKIWTRPSSTTPISTFYGVGAGQVPMDHKYAEGTKSGGNITAVPNLGGAGSAFNLTVNGSVPVSGNGVDLDPSDYFTMPTQADLVGVRFFFVADFKSVSANQYFAGQNEANASGGRTNLFLLSGGNTLRIARNAGSNINVDVSISPAVAPVIRLYEIEMTASGNAVVWINGEQRGSIPNVHSTYLINRIAAGQATGGGMSAILYRSLSLIQGGDYAGRVTAIRARLNEQYSLGMNTTP